MAFRFYKKFQDLVKNKLAGKSLSTFQRLQTGYFGKGLSAAVKKSVDELKINKDEKKASPATPAAKATPAKADEKKENTKQPMLEKAVSVAKNKTKKTKSKEPVSTAKKKEKKPVSPGTAAINV